MKDISHYEDIPANANPLFYECILAEYIDWSDLLKRLDACPHLEFVQSESIWLKYHVSVKQTVDCFNRIFAK